MPPIASRRRSSAAPSAPARCGRCSLQSRHASAVGRRVREQRADVDAGRGKRALAGRRGREALRGRPQHLGLHETVRDGDAEAPREMVVAGARGAHRLAPRDRAQAARRAQGCERREALERALRSRRSRGGSAGGGPRARPRRARRRRAPAGARTPSRARPERPRPSSPTDHARPSKSASTIAARAGAASRRPSAARSVVSCMRDDCSASDVTVQAEVPGCLRAAAC